MTTDAFLTALDDLGCGGCLRNWLVRYITSRVLFVDTYVGNTASHKIISGVPKVGILSPTLFATTLINITAEMSRTVYISICADELSVRSSGTTPPKILCKL